MFQNIFGDDFIYRMKSRIESKSSINPKEMDDPDPEIPDDLEISNDSDSLRLSFHKDPYILNKVETEDKSCQTEDLPKSEKKKKTKNRIVKKFLKKESSRDLLEALEKTKKEKEFLESSLLREAQGEADANDMIKLSMKYITKAMNGYNRFFCLNDSKENSLVRQRKYKDDNDLSSDSHESIALKLKREAIASSNANQLAKQGMLKLLMKGRNFDETGSALSKKSKKKKIITRIIRKTPSSTTPRGREQYSKYSPSRKDLSKNRDRSAALLNSGNFVLPPLSNSKSPTKTRSREKLRDRSGGKSDISDFEAHSSPSQKTKKKKKIIRKVIRRIK